MTPDGPGQNRARRRSPSDCGGGDPRPDLLATRAITVDAPAGRVWPWIAQLGQGRDGFYTYDWLENLVGLGMHSAARVVPAWQDIQVGDQVRLAADIGLTVAVTDRGQALSCAGAYPWAPRPARMTSPGAGSCEHRQTGQHG